MGKKIKQPPDQFLAAIRDLLLRPILLHKHPEEENKQFLIRMFHLDTRIIDDYTVKHTFKMPGLLYLNGGAKIQGLGFRKMKQLDRLLVRHDLVTGVIDVEFKGGPGNKTHVFCLTDKEWGRVKLKLTMLVRRSQSVKGIYDPDPSR